MCLMLNEPICLCKKHVTIMIVIGCKILIPIDQSKLSNDGWMISCRMHLKWNTSVIKSELPRSKQFRHVNGVRRQATNLLHTWQLYLTFCHVTMYIHNKFLYISS